MMPPPMKPPGGPPPTAAGPPPAASAGETVKGKIPVAYRTRSKNRAPADVAVDRKMTTAPPHPPIPAGGANNATSAAANAKATTTTTTATATMLMDLSSHAVDDAIAKRRAELRRLQANRGGSFAGRAGPPGGLATARSRLGHRSGGGAKAAQTPLFGGGGGGGGRAVAATAALLNRGGVPSSTSSGGGGKASSTTPSTAAIARRLDASYGPPKNPLVADAAAPAPPSARRGPPAPQSKPSLGDLKRSSDIFSAGERQQQASGNATATAAMQPLANLRHTSEVFETGKRQTASSPKAGPEATSAAQLPSAAGGRSSPTPRPFSRSDVNSITKSPPKSPFGNARATATPLIPNPGKTVPVLPIMVPPLAMEPPSSGGGDGGGGSGNATGAAKSSAENQPKPLRSAASSQPPKSKVARNAPSAKAAKQQQSANQKPGEEIESGKSTPVISNVHLNVKAGAVEAKDGGPTEQSVTKGLTGKSQERDPSNVLRLVKDLERTEQEKKEALEQVYKLKSLLARGKQRQDEKPKQLAQQKPSLVVNSNSGLLLDQFKEMVSTQGESAAVAWISKQLEDYDGHISASPSSVGSRGRDAEGTHLLSSIVPPLTPRSRPGSRAASPERGGGGGLLLSQSLGHALDKAAPARGKRMTTPLPKNLNGGPDGNAARREGPAAASENVERGYLEAAARSIPNEYGTQLASYFVRRPYVGSGGRGVATGEDGDMWESYSHLAAKEEYLSRATALDPSSVEVLAYVEPDGSVFTLTGISDARHGKLPNISSGNGSSFEGENSEDSYDWAVFNDVEDMDRELGRVTYIDVEGNEREYWLDSIYEEALTTRESYCMSMISAAYALKEVTGGMGVSMQQMPPMQPSPIGQPVQQEQQTLDAGDVVSPQPPHMQPSVAPSTQFMPPPADSIPSNQMHNGFKKTTSRMPQPELPKPDKQSSIPSDPSQPSPKQPPSDPKSKLPPAKEQIMSTTKNQKQPTTSTSKPPPEEDYEPADSAMTFMVISLFSLLFSMVWFFAKIPFRIGLTFVKFWVFVIAARILWLFLADDTGAWEMGAGVDYEYNMPGIY